MFSRTQIAVAALLASAVLYTVPLAAALKTKPSVSTRSAAPTAHLKVSASRTSSRASSRTQAHKSTASAAVATRKPGHGKVAVATTAKPKFRGQQAIDQERTLEIQQALIREHYLAGEASGQWDQATRDALIRFQGDNHWQTKILPDSRALIKLGLGPSQQNLLNPESAAMAVPYRVGLETSLPGGSN